ncbi:HlyD family efflux transporter periplasmic adaptor subunit [candidate division KSB1 bacterium]|nr:HlyD family efflux transporter periplasmic adaptor subunit [candidate division KSB1 bacterium]
MDRKIKKKVWTLKRIATISFVLIFISAISYPLLFGRKGSKLNVDVERITISTVQKGPFLEFFPERGAIIPITTQFLDAVEGGIVKKILLEAGANVIAGDEILVLENTTLVMDIMLREAEFVQQENNLRNTRLLMQQNELQFRQTILDNNYQVLRLKQDYDRRTVLFEENVISREEFEGVKNEYEYQLKRSDFLLEAFRTDSLMRESNIISLESILDRMQANLEFVREKRQALTLRAPITGLLSSLNAEVGQSIGRGQRFGRIDVLDGFKVRSEIDEFYIDRINVGQTATFNITGKEEQLIITKVFPEVLNGQFIVELEFKNSDPPGIRRGQTLQLRFLLGGLSEAILLPTGGFFQKTGGNWVYLVDESGEIATKRFIKINRQNTEAYEVIDGLVPGDRVITSSYDTFGDIDILILKY